MFLYSIYFSMFWLMSINKIWPLRYIVREESNMDVLRWDYPKIQPTVVPYSLVLLSLFHFESTLCPCIILWHHLLIGKYWFPKSCKSFKCPPTSLHNIKTLHSLINHQTHQKILKMSGLWWYKYVFQNSNFYLKAWLLIIGNKSCQLFSLKWQV